jgi:hypothetical protein
MSAKRLFLRLLHYSTRSSGNFPNFPSFRRFDSRRKDKNGKTGHPSRRIMPIKRRCRKSKTAVKRSFGKISEKKRKNADDFFGNTAFAC